MITGLWTLEVSDHALLRLCQRDPGADLDAVLLEAHRAILRAPATKEIGAKDEIYLMPAGSGVFLCQLHCATDRHSGDICIRFRARTWLHRDQLGDNQEASIVRGVDRLEGPIPLGACWFMPYPFVNLTEAEPGIVRPEPWVPGFALITGQLSQLTEQLQALDR
jgi:hypothetical protein